MSVNSEGSMASSLLFGSGHSDRSPGSLSPGTTPRSPRSVSPLDQLYSKDKFDTTACMIAAGLALTLLMSLFMMASVFSWSGRAWFDEDQNAPSNWCPELVVREFGPQEVEISVNQSRIVGFYNEKGFAVSNFIRLEVKWYLKARDLDSEPFIAFVVRGKNMSLAYLMELRSNDFKVISLDPNPLYHLDQLKERHPRARTGGNVHVTQITPLRTAIYVREDYLNRRMTMELYDSIKDLYSNSSLVSKHYQFEPRRPLNGLSAVMYIIGGTMRNETEPPKLKISYKHVGCNVDQKIFSDARLRYEPLCRSKTRGRYYTCVSGDSKDTENSRR